MEEKKDKEEKTDWKLEEQPTQSEAKRGWSTGHIPEYGLWMKRKKTTGATMDCLPIMCMSICLLPCKAL